MIVKDQILYRNTGKDIEEYTVDTVGIKYFTCTKNKDKLNIDNLTYECKNYSQYNYQHLFLNLFINILPIICLIEAVGEIYG